MQAQKEQKDDSNQSEIIPTLNSAYNKKKSEILLHYRQLFIKGGVIIGDWSIFGVEIFLPYRQFFLKGNFVIGGVECISFNMCQILDDNYYNEKIFNSNKIIG